MTVAQLREQVRQRIEPGEDGIYRLIDGSLVSKATKPVLEGYLDELLKAEQKPATAPSAAPASTGTLTGKAKELSKKAEQKEQLFNKWRNRDAVKARKFKRQAELIRMQIS